MEQPAPNVLDAARDNHVRLEFAKPLMFGRPDIFEWLADPEWTGIIDYDKAPAFVRFLESFWKDVSLSTDLWQHATPYFGMDMAYLDRVPRDHRTAFAAMHSALDSRSRSFFPWVNDSHAHLVVIVGVQVFRFVPSPTADGPVVSIHKASVRDVLEIFNAEVKGARPKSEAARTFMNRLASQAVAHARNLFEREFDEAMRNP